LSRRSIDVVFSVYIVVDHGLAHADLQSMAQLASVYALQL
jgi:hypothetical protein